MHREPICVLVLLALGALLALTVGRWHQRTRPRVRHLLTRGRSRVLRPRTPADCPACRAQAGGPKVAGAPPVPPWRAIKSRRGAPKRLDTQGYACPTQACLYHGVRDATIHALVSNGHHGTTDRIQDLRCQACGTNVSTRRETPLYHLRTPPQRVGEVLSALAEGLDSRLACCSTSSGGASTTIWCARTASSASLCLSPTDARGGNSLSAIGLGCPPWLPGSRPIGGRSSRSCAVPALGPRDQHRTLDRRVPAPHDRPAAACAEMPRRLRQRCDIRRRIPYFHFRHLVTPR
jgi:hypothetical protein